MAATALRIWGNISDTVVTPSEKMKKNWSPTGLKAYSGRLKFYLP